MIVYCITNKVNGKKYVGITIHSLEWRWNGHVKTVIDGYQSVFACTIRKHGVENFEPSVIEEVDSIDVLKEREVFWIANLKTYVGDEDSCGYNMTRGGDGTMGNKLSDESKNRQSIAAKGVKKSEAHKKNLSIGQRKRFDDPIKYQEYLDSRKDMDVSFRDTPEYKAKISKLHTGRKRSNETRERMSKAQMGHKVSIEARKKNSKRLIGNKYARRTPVHQIDINTGKIIATYESLWSASQAIGTKASGYICNACKGKSSSAHGYIWKYVDDVNVLNDDLLKT